ncbi:MAG: uracil-DNA glycosylase [Chloroflexota bacterium]
MLPLRFLWQQLNDEIVACRRCNRLVEWREQVARERRRAFFDWNYWGKPVPGFGDRQARVLVVGLAPGAHGSNRTGRMFTGDSSGDFLYRALYEAGFANQPQASHAGDGLELREIFITAVCRCAPPNNRPTPQEILNCQPFLMKEMQLLERLEGIVALGKVAFDRVQKILKPQSPLLSFSHAAFYRLGEGLPWLLASYHPSRQNTQTGKLTREMFAQVWEKVKMELD